jgi:pilus assembly protein CpaB
MSRNTRTLLVLAVALVVAGGASFMVYNAVQNIPVREVEVRNYFVAVAARPLPVGSLIQASDVKLVAWPESSPVAGGISKTEEVVNRGLIDTVSENEPITTTKLAPVGAGGGLPPMITAGMRAISVRVNEVIGVAGFVIPGTFVDVVLTMNRGNQQQEAVARIVLANVQVLTAGTRIDQEQSKDGRAVPSTVVTLLVTPENAEKVALAGTVGTITLILRNPLDQETTDTKGTRVAALLGAPEPPPVVKTVSGVRRVVERPKEAPAPAPSIYSVETIRAAKRTAEVVK